MTIFTSTRKQLLDPEECWNDWIKLGSLTRVRREYAENGILNPRTGDAPNESAIQKSAYSYAVNNIQIARERFEHECRQIGEIPTDDLWKRKLYKIGWLLYYQRPNRMREFVAKHGLEAYVKHN